jgi:hypothetical protein
MVEIVNFSAAGEVVNPIRAQFPFGYSRLQAGGARIKGQISERRSTDRLRLRIPLRLRVWGTAEQEQAAESIDISESGVLIETALPLQVGAIVELRLQLATGIPEPTTSDWRCRGLVVHVASVRSLKGVEKVGVYFERVESG